MKVQFKFTLRFTFLLLGALITQAMFYSAVFAQAKTPNTAPDIKLPVTPVVAQFVQNYQSPDGDGFFLARLSGVPNGVDIGTGDYIGWCVDPYSGYEYENILKAVTLYSTYAPNLPANVKDKNIPWDKINYLLNHKNGQPKNVVQAAMWFLLFGDRNAWISGWECAVGSACDALVKETNAKGAGFVPGPGQVLAVLQYHNGITRKPQNDGWQETIIEAPLGKLGDFVWNDNNANGLQENGEPGIANVQVDLLDSGSDSQCNSGDEVLIKSTTTNDKGFYLFIVATPRSYCVAFKAPAGLLFSPPSRGNGVNDSKPDQASGQTIQPAFVPTNGENLDQDAGLYPATQSTRYSLGDRVWYDQDQDGVQDVNEPSYNGAVMQLFNNASCSGSPITTATSGSGGAAGFYQFSNLNRGAYSAKLSNLPVGWKISPAEQGDEAQNSDANAAGCIENINLTANDANQDIGVYVPNAER
jgi:hypothetical protein